ncbi:heterokaryon incompatibility protein-domain-containing protein [Plectosphaerella plurivora]|uniref:Heterokaryon incompatibility protein-domain-containing protein n=1 Tax=Plectosphaerella plurivora TaxID=936078 RepID=A0A9P8VBN5_9PEZI|nr:heterokaryon incompatibility protein-domain-containing protein [Plectosphaerella plurivora]
MPSRRDLPQNGYFEHTSIPELQGRPDPEISEKTVDVSLDGQYLCPVCVKLRAQILDIWKTRETTEAGTHTFNETLPHHNSTYALTEGYLKGCTFCALIWNSLSNVHRRKPTLADLRQWRQMWTQSMRLGGNVDLIATGSSRKELVLWPRFVGPRGEVSSVRRRCYLSVTAADTSPQPPAFTYGSGPQGGGGCVAPPVSTSSPAIVEHAIRMLKECHDSHEQCRRPSDTALPNRLLEIDGEENVRLVKGETLPPHTPYIALSYCWGRQPSSTVMQLTLATLASFNAGFLIELLPKTVREAIHFTRRIGIRHIWVDLLCIVQDSPEDKAGEIDAMASIYEGSHLTICALGAESMDGGLYSLRNPFLYSSIPLTETGGRRVDIRFKMSDDSWWWWPAHKRGWIYQERILSRRVLSFGPFMVWTCRQTMVKEFDITPSYGDGRFVLSSQLYRSLIATEASREDRSDAVYKAWHEVLHHFHFTDLRFKTDRLAAVTGVMSLVKRQTGWDNHAGLWEPFLLRELLWEPSVRPVHSTGLAPSWSWIAWDGRIEFKGPEQPDCSGIVELATVQRVPDIPPDTTTTEPSLLCLRINCMPLKVLSIRRREGIPNAEIQDWPFPSIIQYTPDGDETDRAAELLLPCMWDDMYIYGLMVVRSRRKSPTKEALYERVGLLKALKGQALSDAVVYWGRRARKAFEDKLRDGVRRPVLIV